MANMCKKRDGFTYHWSTMLFVPISHCDRTSIAICIPSLNACSNYASSKRLACLLQQSWNFSKVFSCSSVMIFCRSSLCLLMYSNSCCTSWAFGLPPSSGIMFPRKNPIIILFMGCSFCQHITIPQKGEKVQICFATNSTFFSRPFLYFLRCNFSFLWVDLAIGV